SSTINMMGDAVGIGARPNSWLAARASLIVYPQHESSRRFSACLKRCIQRIKQGRVAERLVQHFYRSSPQGPPPDSFVPPCGNKDDRNLLPTTSQFLLQIKSCHARHSDVQDQAPGPIDIGG